MEIFNNVKCLKINKIVANLLLIFGCGVVFVNAQADNDKQAKYDKAKDIIKKSQDAIFKKEKLQNIRSILLKSNGEILIESTSNIEGETKQMGSKINQKTEESISWELFDKLNFTTINFEKDKNPIENFTKMVSTINADKYSVKTDSFREGKRLDLDSIFDSPFFSESSKKEMKEVQQKVKPTKETIQNGVKAKLFPILLDLNLLQNTNFIYIGKAEIGEVRADVLELETKTAQQMRYFFDEKTHLLLLITDEISNKSISSKTTTYFSDYQNLDGLLVAKRVNVETESSTSEVELEIMGKKIKSSTKSKVTYETIIQDFKINPKFKPEIFSVNE